MRRKSVVAMLGTRDYFLNRGDEMKITNYNLIFQFCGRGLRAFVVGCDGGDDIFG